MRYNVHQIVSEVYSMYGASTVVAKTEFWLEIEIIML